MIRYGTFEAMPAVWNDTEGWVCYNGDWSKTPVVDLQQTGNIIGKAKFEAAFPQLPPMPKALFQSDE